MHDTHLHLEMFLQKLGFLPEERETLEILPSLQTEKFKQICLEELSCLDFAWQSTVSLPNFLFVRKLFDFPEIAKKLYFWLGFHPERIQTQTSDQELEIEILAMKDFLQARKNNSQFLGLGEIGLDYFHAKDKKTRHKQIEVLHRLLHLATEFDLPVMFHCREAFADLLPIISEYPQVQNRFLVHCFTGDKDILRQILDLGGLVGLGGILTYKSAIDLQTAAQFCPPPAFVLETDLPFLAPQKFRGQTCRPHMIAEVAQKLSELQSLQEEEIWHWSEKNCRKLLAK